jgi:hypothetical protein
VDVSFENDRLSFDLDTPVYKTKDLAGSSAAIEPLLGDNTSLAITLQTESILDDEIHELLKAYNIRLPLTQQTGTTRGNLQLVFDLPGFRLHTKGAFTTDKGGWTWNNIPFRSDAAAVRLKDNLVTIDNAEINFKEIMQADLAGVIDTAAHKATLSADIRHLDLRDGKTEYHRAAPHGR